MAQIHPALLDDGRMSLLAMPACPSLPLPNRALIEPKGRDNRLQGAAVTKQDEHHGHQVGSRAQPIKRRPFGRGKGLLAGLALIALLLLAMDMDVALPYLDSPSQKIKNLVGPERSGR